MKFIMLFEEVGNKDVSLVGGKNASLGEMINHLKPLGLRIPTGFAITADAYRHHLSHNNLIQKIEHHISTIDKKDLPSLQHAGQEIRNLIKNAPLDKVLITDIQQAYSELEVSCGKNVSVAIRSSATAEDLPTASFAGQQETYLHVQGIEALIELVPHAFASLFTDRALSYREDQGFDHMDVALSVGVQQMIRSDLATSGVIFTLDTESGFSDVVYITSSYGLGEPIVQGTVNPDECYVHKKRLEQGYKPILKKRVGSKESKMILSSTQGMRTVMTDVEENERHKFSLSNQEILLLAQQALTIEKHYTEQRGVWTPMDIEWAKDGESGELFIVQARPETVHSQKQNQPYAQRFLLDSYNRQDHPLLTQGQSVGKKIVSGKARVVTHHDEMHQVQSGDILVADMTDPDWEPIMKIAAGIVTNRGGRTCHAAIVSRELGITSIVGTHNGTEVIKTGDEVTLDCSSGGIGKVFKGRIPFLKKRIPLNIDQARSHHLMMNVGHPDEVFHLANIPSEGVGLARLEFIINTSIQIHPMALLKPEEVTDGKERASIEQLTSSYDDKQQYFVNKLAEEVGAIAAAFDPKPVIVRLSDFKSNEYRKLIGGTFFEPVEENPMLGFRGASRYIHSRYKAAFELECKAMKKLREEMGFENVIIMLPFIRTVAEAESVIEVMKGYGLTRGNQKLKLYMMCELPSNIILLEQFAQYFDGFSIGSNDLTQTILGLDRDSELVASLFDERNEAVLAMLEMAINKAHVAGKKIGICGQAPSDYPDLLAKLESWGIDSISLVPDALINMLSLSS